MFSSATNSSFKSPVVFFVQSYIFFSDFFFGKLCAVVSVLVSSEDGGGGNLGLLSLLEHEEEGVSSSLN